MVEEYFYSGRGYIFRRDETASPYLASFFYFLRYSPMSVCVLQVRQHEIPMAFSRRSMFVASGWRGVWWHTPKLWPSGADHQNCEPKTAGLPQFLSPPLDFSPLQLAPLPHPCSPSCVDPASGAPSSATPDELTVGRGLQNIYMQYP